MELNLIELLANASPTAIIAILCYLFGTKQLKHHKESLDRVCENHKEVFDRACETYERGLDRRDKDIETLTTEIRILKSGIHNG